MRKYKIIILSPSLNYKIILVYLYKLFWYECMYLLINIFDTFNNFRRNVKSNASWINRKINLKHQSSDKSERISNLSKRLQAKKGERWQNINLSRRRPVRSSKRWTIISHLWLLVATVESRERKRIPVRGTRARGKNERDSGEHKSARKGRE